MNDEPEPSRPTSPGIDRGRRDFVALSVATGIAAATGPAAAALAVTERDVSIQTPDGRCDAAFFYPAAGAHPAVVVWPDAAGLRPAMRAIGRRLAGDGYSVIVPNPFYRVAQGVVYETAANVDFQDPATRARLAELMGSINAEGAAERDAAALVAFLDAQPQVDRRRKIGTQGYCMGGALTFRTAAAVPDRIGAGASFHGGALVSDRPDSPHRLVRKIRGRMYVAIAANDDTRQPDAKERLREAFAAAKVPGEVEVYPARHGWCVPDMPIESGSPIYSAPDAERAWSKLLALYRAALVA